MIKRTQKPLLDSGHGMSNNDVSNMNLDMRDMIDKLQQFRDCLDEHESMFMGSDGELADTAGQALLDLCKSLDAMGY